MRSRGAAAVAAFGASLLCVAGSARVKIVPVRAAPDAAPAFKLTG